MLTSLKESFVTGAIYLVFNVISRFRDDVRLLYLYNGPKTGKRGRPKMYAGKVNLKELNMQVLYRKKLQLIQTRLLPFYLP